MGDVLIYTLDKFTFSVPPDRRYLPAGLWAQEADGRVTVGVTDYFQQRNGDVAFAEVLAVGTRVAAGDGFATLETMKVSLELPSPVAGTIVAVNEALELEAEVINQDPYGAGWLAVIVAPDWPGDAARLLAPEAYFEHMKGEAQAAW